jgi:hypothetical protein
MRPTTLFAGARSPATLAPPVMDKRTGAGSAPTPVTSFVRGAGERRTLSAQEFRLFRSVSGVAAAP